MNEHPNLKDVFKHLLADNTPLNAGDVDNLAAALVVFADGYARRASQVSAAAPAEQRTLAGWFIYEGNCWVATSSDDPRATQLFRASEGQAQTRAAMELAEKVLCGECNGMGSYWEPIERAAQIDRSKEQFLAAERAGVSFTAQEKCWNAWFGVSNKPPSSAPPAQQSLTAGGAVPEGYALVPIKPTPKMVDATWNDDPGNESHNTRNARIYAAMLAAAPLPPVQPSEGK